MKSKRVLIIGAGIAGCAAALSLSKLGMSVSLIEKQTEWRFQSSGIFIYNNGLAALNQLGVLESILEKGFAIKDGCNSYLDHLGNVITTVYYPHGPNSEPPIVGIKRADMHYVLAAALKKEGIEARLGLSVKSVIPGDLHRLAQVVFNDGLTENYDLIIGADGIRSFTREQLFGPIAPRDTGFGVWRSVHARPEQITTKIMQMGIGKRLGIMPISDDRLYIFGTVPEKELVWYEPKRWPQIMQDIFSEFSGPVRSFLDELNEDSEVLYTRVEEVVAPLPWHQGRALLIGDASHASTPFMGQGGAMALEDAVVLADCLQQHSLFGALEQFERRRFAMCQYVQNSSRQVGEAGAIEDPESCLQRNSRMRENAQQQVDQFYQQLSVFRNLAVM